MKYKLEDVCKKIYSGGTPSTKQKEYWNGNLMWLSSGETRQRFIYNTEKRITELGAKKSSTKLAEKGSVVMASAGQGYTRGQVSYLMEDMYVNQSVIIFSADQKLIEPLYLYYNLDGRYNELRQLSDGTSTRGSLSGRIVKGMEIDIPTIDVQKKIVDILYNIDKKIENNEAINRNLEEQANILYEEWKEKLSKDLVELSKVIDVRDGTHDSPKIKNKGYPLVTSKYLMGYDVDLQTPNLISKEDYVKINNRSKVDQYDVLMSMIGTVGLISFVSRDEINFAIKNVALFKTSKKKEFVYYFLMYLKSKETMQNIEKCLAGSTQKYISLGELRKLKISVPTDELLRQFNSIVEPIIIKICNNFDENRRLVELRDTLLPKLISGDLDVFDLQI